MSQALSFVTLLRVFYTGILLFFAIILLREVWFIWFDRHMTLGEIKYFDGIKVEQAAGDRFRHLLRQEYNHDLDHIRNYARIFQTITGRASDSKPSLFRLEGKLEPANLTSAKGFESFAAKEHEFAALDISFQGIDIKRIFSSVRTYLSPSVDLNLVVTKNSAEDMRVNIRWPREGRALEGLFDRFLDFEIGPYKDDAALARKASCYLVWLQAFNKQQQDVPSFHEFCLWFDGLRMLSTLADAKINLAINGGPGEQAVAKFAEQFARGFMAEFDYAETYRVAATFVAQAPKSDSKLNPATISIGGKNLRVDPEFLVDVLNYYYVHLASNPTRRKFFRRAAKEFTDADSGDVITPERVGRQLLADRVVPWSRIVPSLAPQPTDAATSSNLETILFQPSERFESEDIGPFGFPRREVRSILRDVGPDGKWQGTAFLVAPDVALAVEFNHRRRSQDNAQGLGYVEYVLSPYSSDNVKFQPVAIKKVVPLITDVSPGVVALQLETQIPDATPFKLAPHDGARQRAGQSVYLLSYLGKPAKEASQLDAVFNGEFERPIYLGATVLLQTDDKNRTQYAYDAFTLPGASGSPVVDAANGQVIAMHHSGLLYSRGVIKVAVGLDITGLSKNATLDALVRESHNAHKSPKH